MFFEFVMLSCLFSSALMSYRIFAKIIRGEFVYVRLRIVREGLAEQNMNFFCLL